MTDDQWNRLERLIADSRREVMEHREESRKRFAEMDKRYEESRVESNKRFEELHAKTDDGLRMNRVLIENLERSVQVLAEHQVATNDSLVRLESRFTGLEHRLEGIDLRVIRIEAHLENGASPVKRRPTKRPRAKPARGRKERR